MSNRFKNWFEETTGITTDQSYPKFTKEFLEHAWDCSNAQTKQNIIEMIKQIQPAGGRMWSTEQLAVFEALEELKRGIESCRF
jgi:hypothetical protein